MTPADARKPPLLSLVIPCYDEAETLPALIRRIEETFGDEPDTEVVLVDNGSTDDTPAILRALDGHPRMRTTRVEVNQGYGFGILEGLRVCRGQYLGWTHADLQADPADALRGLAMIRESGGEPVYLKGRRHGRPFFDVVFTVGMSLFESVLLRAMLWDINAQPNIFPRALYEHAAPTAPHDWSLDLYFYYAARRKRLRVRRFPVTFGPRAHGSSHWNVDWTAKPKFIARTVRFSLGLRGRARAAGIA